MNQKAEKGFVHLAMILTIVAVLAAVGFGAWYVWQRNEVDLKSDDTTETKSNNGAAEKNSSKQNREPHIPENFMLYTDEDLGFSFAYPEKVGPLTVASPQANSNILSYVKSNGTENVFANNTQSPLYARADKTDGFVNRAAKYGPVLEFINNKWIVTDKDGGDTSNGGYKIGSEYKPTIARTINGTAVYDFSFTDEGCYRTIWIFKLQMAFVSITLPEVCADGIDAIPQERLENYKKISDQVLETLSL